MTVRGHGRLVATAARFLASNLSSQSFLTSSLDTRPVRAADDDTVIPVDHNLLAVFDAQKSKADADDHRHPKRSRHDGGVGRDTSLRQGGAARGQAKVRDVGGAEVGRDQHSPRTQRRAQSMSRRTPTEAAHVVGALRQGRIMEQREQVGAFLRSGNQGRSRAAPFPHERLDARDQTGIPRHQDARFHNLGIVMPPTAFQLARDVLESLDLRLQGSACSLLMRGALGRRDKIVIFESAQHDGFARDHAGRGADPSQGKLAH